MYYPPPLLLATFGLLVTGNPIAQSAPSAPDNQVNLYVPTLCLPDVYLFTGLND